MIRWHEVTALFGGTFDPPHLGHREAVRGLFVEPGVSRVLILPAPNPPHKPTLTPWNHRLEMTRLNFSSTLVDPYPKEVEMDLREIRRAQATGRPTYTFDSLREVGSEIPSLAFVIGSDQLRDMETWHRFPEVLELCNWIVLDRKSVGETESAPISEGLRALAEWKAGGLIRKATVTVVQTPAPALSSTRIREALSRTGEAPEGSLLPEVLSYLKRNGLYGTKKGTI